MSDKANAAFKFTNEVAMILAANAPEKFINVPASDVRVLLENLFDGYALFFEHAQSKRD